MKPHVCCIWVWWLLFPSGISAQETPNVLRQRYCSLTVTVEETRKIEAVIDRLVFSEGTVSNQRVFTPGVNDKSDEYVQRFKKVQEAFYELQEMKVQAFPVLIRHFNDKRQSIPFRNHFLGNSVGDACFWVIFFQLEGLPKGYPRYGWDRIGRDGRRHPQPYYSSSPFKEAGGLEKWLHANQELTYLEMQIKCLRWFLEEELKIGIPGPTEYFQNILPLEVQILKRELENGADVKEILDQKVATLEKKDSSQIPPGLLPNE